MIVMSITLGDEKSDIMKIFPPKLCELCSTPYVPKGPNARYCGPCGARLKGIRDRRSWRKYDEQNRKKKSKWHKEYRERNRDRLNDYSKAYYIAHRANILLAKRAYKDERREELKQKRRKYLDDHPEYVKKHSKRVTEQGRRRNMEASRLKLAAQLSAFNMAMNNQQLAASELLATGQQEQGDMQ